MSAMWLRSVVDVMPVVVVVAVHGRVHGVSLSEGSSCSAIAARRMRFAGDTAGDSL